MSGELFIAIAIVVVLGSTLQSAAGFAFGMFAIPLLIILGSESYEAIAIISICGAVQTVLGSIALRHHIHWRQVGGMIALAGACLPIGVWAQGELNEICSVGTIRQVFGGIVLAALIAQWTFRVEPREKLHWFWGVGATGLGGFMAGLAGMGGPPVVLWIMAHRWSNPRSRATLWMLFTGLTPFQLFFLHQRFGEPVLGAIGDGAMLAPFVLLGLVPGLWLGARISKRRLRWVSYGILLAISAYAIVQPLIAILLG
jgi:uncharacterized membrane protein YfcA